MPGWKIKLLDAYIMRHLPSRIAIRDMADICALSKSHFQRMFQQCFGRTPQSYVTEQRLRLAQRMLVETSKPIKHIALECGMADQAHLTNTLKRRWNTTPLALRRTYELPPENAEPTRT